MKIARTLSLLALALTLVPAILFAVGRMSDAWMKLALVAGTILWFAAAPRWLRGGND
jgi:hypothetical protein